MCVHLALPPHKTQRTAGSRPPRLRRAPAPLEAGAAFWGAGRAPALAGERSAGGRKQHGLSRSPLVLTIPALSTRPTQSPYEVDLLHPLPSVEASKHKLKRLVQAPNSFFMDVKCPGCFNMCAPASRPRPPGCPQPRKTGRANPRNTSAPPTA